MLKLKIFAVLILALGVESHVWLYNPISRSSVWRDPQFAEFEPVPNYNDNENNCGRAHQLVVPDNCGICGDPVDDALPRPNENGGLYGKGIIVGNYSAGGLVDITLDFQPTHGGYVEFQLCADEVESDECFYKNVLPFVDGSTTYPVAGDGVLIVYETQVQLPAGVTCSRCTLRMNYRAGNKPDDPLQETFRQCSDISIM